MGRTKRKGPGHRAATRARSESDHGRHPLCRPDRDSWRHLPHDFAPWETVYGYFAAWQKDEVFDQLNGLLRRLVREAEGRDVEPSACVLYAQSIKASTNVPSADQGIDAGKKIAGRKRHIDVDTPGLLLAVLVTAASVSDNAASVSDNAAASICLRTPPKAPRITKNLGRHRRPRQGHRARRPPGRRRRSHRHDPAQRGFKVIPRRWAVERTFGWLMHHRRLARDYETHPHRSEAMIKVAMADLTGRRLIRESTRTGATHDHRPPHPHELAVLCHNTLNR